MRIFNHPNIMKIVDMIQTAKQIYLIMEYIGTSNLYHYTCTKNDYIVDEENARQIFRKVVSAVLECHRKGVVHRDLKMENIMINKNKEVKIIDFGFSLKVTKNERIEVRGKKEGTIGYWFAYWGFFTSLMVP